MFFIGFPKSQIVFNILIAGRQNWLFWGLLWVGLCVGANPKCANVGWHKIIF